MAPARFRRFRVFGWCGIISIFIMISGARAQTYLPAYGYGPFGATSLAYWAPLPIPGHHPVTEIPLSKGKWFVSRYAAISTGMAFYPGGNAVFLSAPVGVQLNRRLNPNWYAFGGVYVAPTVAGFSRSFLGSSPNSFYPANPYGPYQFSVNPGVQAGFMYVNDAGTFSISGRVSVERSSYPVYYPATGNQRKK
ncbi:MAG TPA: hypothetical protein VG890_13715 [Puia sp.]|nr:hypothetical protein [Puia sp.]